MSNVQVFRSKSAPVPDRASRDVGRAALAEIKSSLNCDPIADVWARLSPVQRLGIVRVAGLSDDLPTLEWRRFSGDQKNRIISTLRVFASLSVKILDGGAQ